MRAGRRWRVPDETIQVVLDDATAARLRVAAAERSMDVERLIVEILHAASHGIPASWDVVAPDGSGSDEGR